MPTFMAREVLFDTSGFFAVLDERDPAHPRAIEWLETENRQIRPITTEWIVGETCTLLVARKRPHLVAQFLNSLESSKALLLVNPDADLLRSTKTMIKQQADQGYSFVDCLSFCLMKERRVREALSTDEHFFKAGFQPVLV
jgi:predicted nucleic acid-binding protein